MNEPTQLRLLMPLSKATAEMIGIPYNTLRIYAWQGEVNMKIEVHWEVHDPLGTPRGKDISL